MDLSECPSEGLMTFVLKLLAANYTRIKSRRKLPLRESSEMGASGGALVARAAPFRGQKGIEARPASTYSRKYGN